MKLFRKSLTLCLLIFVMSACSQTPKVLVLYYSQCGTTKAVAENIQQLTGADIVSIDVTEPYDGTYEETIQRCIKEREGGLVPDLAPLDADLSKYDLIFLGYPVWFGTYAPPVAALLNAVDLSGKTIVPFCTFGSGGLLSSIADLEANLPGCEIREGYGVRAARLEAVPDEVERFLILGGYIEGTVEPVEDYGEMQPVTEEQAAIFEAATSGYMFPLGTAVECASRVAPWGTDYKFIAEGQSPRGDVSRSTILVTVAEGKDPEFTQVIR